MVIEPSVSTTNCSSVKATDLRDGLRSSWSCAVGKNRGKTLAMLDGLSRDGIEKSNRGKGKGKKGKISKGIRLGSGTVLMMPGDL